MSATVTASQEVDRVIQSSNVFFLLRILAEKGVPDKDRKPINSVHIMKGNTVIHRMIPLEDTENKIKASSIYLRPPQLSVGMNNNPNQSIDLIAIENATTRNEADRWFREIGHNYVASGVIDYAIIRIGYEWLDDAILD